MVFRSNNQVFNLQDRFSQLSLFLFGNKTDLSSNHHFRHFFLAGGLDIDSPDIFSLTKHGAPIGYGFDFIQLVGDEEDGFSFGGQILHDFHQLVDLLRRQYRCGFIKNKDFIVPIKHFQDLYPLLHPNGYILY